MRCPYRGRVRCFAVFVAALVLVPSALGDRVVYATDTVATPTHLTRMGIDGRGAHGVASMPVLDYRAGHVAAAHGDTLLVDGNPIATVGWPVDDARLSPDAGEVAFTAISTVDCDPSGTNCATWELWLVDRDGRNLRELTADGRFPQFSPDGKRLAFLGGYSPSDEGGTAVVQTLASSKRTWFTSASDGRPAWTPDSKRIVYSSRGELMVATFAPHRVADLGVRGYVPQLSADGKTLAFSVPRGIAARALAHGTPRLVARGAVGSWSWTPTGWIVYSAITRRYPQIFSLERVRADGTRRAVIHTYAPTTMFDAIWSSGKTLFVQTTRTRFDVATIDSVDLATGAVSTLTNDLADDRSPTFSPAGDLAYVRGSSSRFGWYCLAVRQSCVVNAQTVDGIRQPDWSPDGTRIAFLQYTSHGTNVAVADPNGSHVRVLHNFTGATESPSWSPDGTQIVVGASNYPSRGDGHIHLWVLDVESGAATQLSTGDWGGTPSWSPDGMTIAFVGGTWGGPNTLELYDVSTGRYAPLVQLGSQPVDTRPGWSPDSQRLAYQAEDLTLHVIGSDGSGDSRITGPTATGSTLAWLAG
jgi:Tol biopolymer transport system component